MARLHWPLALAATQILGSAMAADIPYVTEMKLFSSLAPCAATAISANFYALGYDTSECADGETQMHSCVCSNTGDFNSISSAISSRISYSCSVSADATDDYWSASQVLKQYCNPNSRIAFPEPERTINAFITELAQTTNLAQCAQWAVSYGVSSAGEVRCPKDASLFAPCICGKAGVVEDATRIIYSIGRSSCSNNEDATSARNFFFEYCAMNNGTTSFAGPKKPPGDMTYHITDLSQYKSLKSCAQAAFSTAVLSQTETFCAAGPQALASCVCIKSGIFDKVRATLTSSVKWTCDSTDIAAVTSAVSVLEHYCSAARDEITESVKVSATTTEGSPTPTSQPPESETRSLPVKETGGSGGDGGKSEGSGEGSGTNSDGSQSNDKDKDQVPPSSDSGVNRTAIIAAAVLGAFLVIFGIAAVVFFVRRKRQRKAKGEEIPSAPQDTEFQEFNGKPELAGPDPVISRPGTGAVDIDTLKAELPTSASFNELPASTTPRQQEVNPAIPDRRSMAVSEMSPTDTLRPELPSSTPVPAMPHPVSRTQSPQELLSPGVGYQPPPHPQGHSLHNTGASPVSPQSHQGSPIDQFPTHPPAVAQGWAQRQHQMSWHSGPVEAYEMDASDRRNNQ